MKQEQEQKKENFTYDIYCKIVLEMAADSNTPIYILEELHSYDDIAINEKLASNIATPTHILKDIGINAKSSMAFCYILSNTSTPHEVFDKYKHYFHYDWVQRSIASNPSVPNYILNDIINNCPPRWVMFEISRNKNASHKVLENIYNTCVSYVFSTIEREYFYDTYGYDDADNEIIFKELIKHKNCPAHIIKKITNLAIYE